MNPLKLRDSFWEYPYILFIGKASYLGQILDTYNSARPFSYIITTVITSVVLAFFLFNQFALILGFNTDTFVEGIIVGVNASGDPRGPSRLNPLQISIPQLDKDILELVYEPLIKVNQTGEIETVLAEKFTDQSSGKSYRFSLRKDVKWQDGKPFTTQDVKATFELIKEFGNKGVPDIYAGQAATNIKLEILDDYICQFTVDKEIIPNFYELITFKILPSHLIQQYRNAVERQLSGAESLTTVGTGPYALTEVKGSEVILTANSNYYRSTPKIKKFIFKLLRDENEAFSAIKSGQLHGITNIAGDLIKSTEDLPNLEVRYSNVIYNQYWGIYFNLADKGPKSFKNKQVRRAFSQGINRELAIKTIFDSGEVAYGPIAKVSSYYNKSFQQPTFNRDAALETLRKDGWVLKPIITDAGTILVQHKDNEKLEFKLDYVENPDRREFVKSMISDLESIGIRIIPNEIKPDKLLSNRARQEFELMLIGVSTFVDPDRYELFHSSQISSQGNGLNISSYKSEKLISDYIEKNGKTDVDRIPVVDKYLDDARKTTNYDERLKSYNSFQQAIASDVPVIFLYHPTLRYVVSKRIKNMSLQNIKNIEDRFTNIYNWEINYTGN